MSNILLINPPFNILKDNYDSSISVGLLCLASYLAERGVGVKIIDGARQRKYWDLLKEEIPHFDFFGLSVMTTQAGPALKTSRLIRSLNPRAKIVWGGFHPTFFPAETATHPLIDVAVMGEGEETLFEILKNFHDLPKIKGIAFRGDRGVVVAEKRALLEVKDLPLPKWELMPRDILENIDIIPTHTSRGCPHRCAFCVNAITKNAWRSRPPEQVFEDIRIIKAKEYFKNKPLRFWDENFFVNKQRAEAIVDGMIEENLVIPWETTVRANYLRPDLINDIFLDKLRKSGCYLLSFGAESGSDRILKKIKKDVTREEIISSAKQCLKYDIIPQYSFMVGLPGEETSDIKATISLIDELISLSPKVQILGPQAFRPYPGSPLYDECLASGWSAPRSLEEWAEAMQDQLNFLSPRNFPWVKDKDLVESLEAYVRFGAHPLGSALGSTVKAPGLIKLFFVLFCKLRWKMKFFRFPLEIKLAQKFIARSKVYD
jgi:radical SAM superfamily enzyme YgiQ (UPF0313 family)